MTTEELLIRDIQVIVGQLPGAQYEACNELVAHLEAAIKSAGEPVGTLALALVGAKAQAKL
jgi:hypothetical protein